MITLNNVEKVYKTDTIQTLALHQVNLQLSKGEFLSIMGPSGCGKSTLLNIMGLLDRPTQGEVLLEGEPVLQLTDSRLAQIRNEKLGFIFQSYHLIVDLNVLDNVELPLIYRKVSSGQRRKLAKEALEKVGLSARTKHYPNQLSGGQRQRVAIARAIVGQPAVLLADEPTGNLDSVMGEEIMQILMRLNKEEGTTIAMVTHDEAMASRTQRLLRFFDGQVVNTEQYATQLS